MGSRAKIACQFTFLLKAPEYSLPRYQLTYYVRKSGRKEKKHMWTLLIAEHSMLFIGAFF